MSHQTCFKQAGLVRGYGRVIYTNYFRYNLEPVTRCQAALAPRSTCVHYTPLHPWLGGARLIQVFVKAGLPWHWVPVCLSPARHSLSIEGLSCQLGVGPKLSSSHLQPPTPGLSIRTNYLDYRLTCFCLNQAPPRPGSWRHRDLLQVSLEGLEDPPAAAPVSIGIPGTGHRDLWPQQRRVDCYLRKGDTWHLSTPVRAGPPQSVPAAAGTVAWLSIALPGSVHLSGDTSRPSITAYFLLHCVCTTPQLCFKSNGSLIYPNISSKIIIKILFFSWIKK